MWQSHMLFPFLHHPMLVLFSTLLRSNTRRSTKNTRGTKPMKATHRISERCSCSPAWMMVLPDHLQMRGPGWFSTLISYKRGHFCHCRMTYEGTVAALISILLWGMVAKVCLYLLQKLKEATAGAKGLFLYVNVMFSARRAVLLLYVSNFFHIPLKVNLSEIWNFHIYAGRRSGSGGPCKVNSSLTSEASEFDW